MKLPPPMNFTYQLHDVKTAIRSIFSFFAHLLSAVCVVRFIVTLLIPAETLCDIVMGPYPTVLIWFIHTFIIGDILMVITSTIWDCSVHVFNVILISLTMISDMIKVFNQLSYYLTLFMEWMMGTASINITVKLAICIAILIAIRGCIPRYRYDFLTKIGWVKFLSYVLVFFLYAVLILLIV